MTTIGFIGLGAMGAPMAQRLVDADLEVTVFNRTPRRTEPLTASGAKVAANPEEAAQAGEFVITMVADPPALRAVTEGENGALAGLRPGSVLIEMSTVGPAAVRVLAGHVPDDAGLLDAPVLGSVPQAQDGSLRIFVGGDEELVRRAGPILEVLGKPMHVGSLGSGAAAKLVANSTLFGVVAVLGEAIALGKGLGLQPEVLFDVLAATPLAEQAERRRSAVQDGVYPRRFALPLALKDAGLVRDAAEGASVDMRTAAAARSWLADAEEAGWGELDYTAVLARIMGEDQPQG